MKNKSLLSFGSLFLLIIGMLVVPIAGSVNSSGIKLDAGSPLITTNITEGGTYNGLFYIRVNTDIAASGYAYIDGGLYANLDLSSLVTSFIFNSFAYTDGVHTLLIDVTDGATANTLSISFNIKNDVTAPSVSSNLTDGGTYAGLFNIKVDSDEVGSGHAFIDGNLYANLDMSTKTDTFIFNSFAYTDGAHVFSFEVTDASDNTGTEIVNFNILNDAVAPGITTNITEGATYSGIFNIKVDSDEIGSGHAFIDSNLYANLDMSTKTDTFIFNSFAYSDGPHLFTFEVTDASSNTGTLNINFYTENFDPTITANITEGETYSGIFTIQVDTVNVGSGYAYIDTNLYANLDLATKSDTFIFNSFAYTDGAHIFLFEYTDTLETTETLTVNILIKNDFQGPSILTNLTDYSMYEGVITVQVDLDEEGSGNYYVAGQLMGTFAYPTTYTIIDTTSYTDGLYNITYEAFDLNGNANKLTQMVYFDNIVLAIDTSIDPSFNYSGVINILITSNEELEWAEISFDGSAFVNATFDSSGVYAEFTLNTSLISNGNHSMLVVVYDGVIKIGTFEFWISVYNAVDDPTNGDPTDISDTTDTDLDESTSSSTPANNETSTPISDEVPDLGLPGLTFNISIISIIGLVFIYNKRRI